MRTVERVLENRIRGLEAEDDTQFDFMPGKGTTRALFILQWIREEFRGKEKKAVHVLCRLGKSI